MKLVVLDGYTLNPGDLSWSVFGPFAEYEIFDRTPEAEIVTRSKDAEIVLSNKVPLRAATLKALPRLRYIGVTATGYDIIDLEQASRQNIVVTNVPSYSTPSVAQLVFALLLELCNRVGLHDAAVQQGEWAASPDFCLVKSPLIELQDKTMGIIGYGRIGKRVAEIAAAFGMRVLATATRSRTDLPPSVEWESLDAVFEKSDVVSLHCPLNDATRGLINAASIARMKPTAFLINTSRGGLVVEQDLADALNAGRLAGAGLDVLGVEPPRAGNPLIGAKNCFITPHIGWATRESRIRCMQTATENLSHWIQGKPQNVVNAEFQSAN
jgi:glycerate dehydrogenase